MKLSREHRTGAESLEMREGISSLESKMINI